MHHPHLLVDDYAIYSLSSKAKDIVEGNRTIRAIEVVIMAENLTNTQSSSKRVKKNSAFESNEQLKLQLDSEKSLHEVQCFTEELLSTRKTCARGTVLTSFTDPMVNLNIDLLMNRIRSSGNELEHRAKLNLPGTMETLLQKLSTENDDLRRKVSINLINEKLSLKKDIIISELKKEAAKSSVWIADLQEQNDRLSSQLFMFQMQQNAFLQQQQYKVETNLGTDYSNEVDVKPESN